MRSEEEILKKIKEVIHKDYNRWNGDYLSWVEMITTDPPDDLSDLFSEADNYAGDFYEKVFEAARDAIRSLMQH